MLRFWLFPLLASGLLVAQSPEAGRVERNGDRATLVVESPRPLDSAAITLAEQFGLRVNVEDPFYLYSDDIRDIAPPGAAKRLRVPKGGRLAVGFDLLPDGSPRDVPGLLQNLAAAFNGQFPFGVELHRSESGAFTFIPRFSRDAQGRKMNTTPLLDRRVTIPPGRRSIAENAQLMAQALSSQTGLRVHCCQSSVAGIPWGMQSVDFGTKDEPARQVLEKLITLSLEGRANRFYWLQRCDPLPSGWCFINLMHVPESAPAKSAATPPSSGARWFDRKQ